MGPSLISVTRHVRDRVVHLGVEGDAHGVNTRQALARERIEHQGPRLAQRFGFVGSFASAKCVWA